MDIQGGLVETFVKVAESQVTYFLACLPKVIDVEDNTECILSNCANAF
jgi:hypothetical protein